MRWVVIGLAVVFGSACSPARPGTAFSTTETGAPAPGDAGPVPVGPGADGDPAPGAPFMEQGLTARAGPQPAVVFDDSWPEGSRGRIDVDPASSACDALRPREVQPWERRRPSDLQICGPGLADGGGEVALGAERFNGSSNAFGYPTGVTYEVFLRDGSRGASFVGPGGPAFIAPAGALAAQPRGWAGVGTSSRGYSRPYSYVAFSDDGTSVSLPNFDLGGWAQAADPNGGTVLAGTLGESWREKRGPSIIAFTPRRPDRVRWGPRPLASSGAVRAVGVDLAGRSLVLTFASPRFPSGSLTAQWFDADGAPATPEFSVGLEAGPLPEVTYELAPLVGDGLALRRIRTDFDRHESSQWEAKFPSGKASVDSAPAWLAQRPDTRLELAFGGRGYAVLPVPAGDTECGQRVEVLAPAGNVCAQVALPIAPGRCATRYLSLGRDGTLVQLLPESFEEKRSLLTTCTYRGWPQILGEPPEQGPTGPCPVPEIPRPIDLALPSAGSYSTGCRALPDGQGDVAAGTTENDQSTTHTTWTIFDEHGRRAGALPRDSWPPLPAPDGFTSISSTDWSVLEFKLFSPGGILLASRRLRVESFAPWNLHQTDSGSILFEQIGRADRTVLTARRIGPDGKSSPPVGVVAVPGIADLAVRSVVLDGRGHMLATLVDWRASSDVHGIWLDVDGNPLTLPFRIAAGEVRVAALPDGSMAIHSGTWKSVVHPLATSFEAGPEFLRLRPAATTVVLRSGQVALVQPVELHPERVRPVEIWEMGGTRCGSLQLASTDRESGRPEVGRDGTLVEASGSCDGAVCRCDFRWWPGLLR